MNILNSFASDFKRHDHQTMSFQEFLDLCKEDPTVYANASERMLKAFGEPQKVVTRDNPRLSRIFLNKEINVYPAFKDFYGAEEAIEQVVSYFRHSAQGLEEKKQILYLLGPVGGGKSSIAERIKELMESFPIYALAYTDKKGKTVVSPIHESPLGLFDPKLYGDTLQTEYGIDKRYLKGIRSPWATKRLKEFDGDIRLFSVVKLFPSRLNDLAITKVEPGDENNQDISTLVGKTNIRALEFYDQDDVDAYSFSGGLCKGNQGIMEFVEMFKAPIKMLNPLLTATQEGNYKGTEGSPAIPFDGVILAHSNETEWKSFRNDPKNEAFLDRVCIIKVPYCLRYDEEVKIYQKMLDGSTLKNAVCAPHTLKMMAQFSVLTRLIPVENSSIWSKAQIYNGDDIKEQDPRAKNILEYRDLAGVDEGMKGTSTRFAFKILSDVFNADTDEIAADPIHLMLVLENKIVRSQYPAETETRYIDFIKSILAPEYMHVLEQEIKDAYLEDSESYGQSVFETYFRYADTWIRDEKYTEEGVIELDLSQVNDELEKIEKPAGISNPKDFRHDIVNYYLRYKASHNGETPSWRAYEKIKRVIEKKIFSSMQDILPIITFEAKRDSEMEKKHLSFVSRMEKAGYTKAQIRRVVQWFVRYRKAS